ncbi:hypothetical protein LY76DRAFT_388911 [Colletotrichum caudatum]|nr:hypothetical protein LY76DRAFT_388911 [Colletotrichum caudatum]
MGTSGGGMRPSVSHTLSLSLPSSPKLCNTTRLPDICSHQRAEKSAPLQHSVAFNSIPSSEIRTEFFASQRTRAPASPKFDEEDGRTARMLKPCFSGGCLLACLPPLLVRSLARCRRGQVFYLKPISSPQPCPPIRPYQRPSSLPPHLARGIQDCPGALARYRLCERSTRRRRRDILRNAVIPKKTVGGFNSRGPTPPSSQLACR